MRIPEHHEQIFKLIGDDIIAIPTYGTGARPRLEYKGVAISVKILNDMALTGKLVLHEFDVHTGVYRYHVSESIRQFLRTKREPKPTPRRRRARCKE